MNVGNFTAVARDSIRAFAKNGTFRLAAALSYYAILSLAPLLLLALALVGAVFGRDQVSSEIVSQMRQLVGDSGADVARAVVASASDRQQSFWGACIGAAILVFGAIGVFLQLQESINVIWAAPPQPHSAWKLFLWKRLLSVGMLLGVACLLMASLVASTALAAASRYFDERLNGLQALWWSLDFVLPSGVYAALFAVLFKILPDVRVRWRDVWVGAIITSILFSIGKVLIGLYLGRGTVSSAYGAAGSIVALLVWVHYASVIVLFGAEVTCAYSRRRGDGPGGAAFPDGPGGHGQLVPKTASTFDRSARSTLPSPVTSPCEWFTSFMPK